MPSKPNHPVLSTDTMGEVILVYPFSEEEYRKGRTALKNRKAAGIDDVLVEQLKNQGPILHIWLLDMHNKCFTENKVCLCD